MRRRGTIAIVTASLSVWAGLATAAATAAHAGDNDLVMARLATVVNDGGGTPVDVIAHNVEFRSLVSELSMVLAPRLLTPSDTIGYGGFQFSADVAYTSISSQASYWRVLRSSKNPSQPAGMDGASHGASLMPSLGLFMRKGLWLPLPSMEVGFGVVHLLDSKLFTAQGYAKIGLAEGYHDLPIPSVAVRGAVSRLVGEKELDLTIASIDVSVSKHVGVGGTWSIDPFAGWNLLFAIPRSEVIDASPMIDPLTDGHQDDNNLNFVFKDQDNVVRQRLFVGAKLQYYVFALTLEADLALKGTSVDDRAGTDKACAIDGTTENCDSTDQAKSQTTYVASVGLDF